jgi:hypothetical protein
MKNSVLWDLTPCSPLKKTDVSEEHVAFIILRVHVGFLLGLLFDSEDEDMYLRHVNCITTN